MHNVRPLRSLRLGQGVSAVAFALAIVLVLTVAASQAAQAQTLTVLHSFTGGQDGAYAFWGLTMDKAGNNLYGTTVFGGAGYGTVYQLKHKGSNWLFNPLYSFTGGSDGAYPWGRLTLGADGAVYGTTPDGGHAGCSPEPGCGTVFKLRPSPRACTTALCPWTETVLYAFSGHPDGSQPTREPVIFDQEGKIYGATSQGGTLNNNCPGHPGLGCGTIYELTPSGSGWTENLVYTFSGSSDGSDPNTVIFDNAGNLYGAAGGGGTGCSPSGCGVVYRLIPSGAGWTEKVIYSFQGGSDGSAPGPIIYQSGNLYGNSNNGNYNTVFELTPSGSGWTYSLIYSVTGNPSCDNRGNPGPGLYISFMDAAGNLYGTTHCGGAYNAGSVFKLTPSSPYWTYTSLYDFTGGSDGRYMDGNVVSDANGNLYGTTEQGGAYGYGVVWELTP